MKGTEITPEQELAAEEFLAIVSRGPIPDNKETRVTLAWSRLVRLIAWYGEMRAVGGVGDGQVEIKRKRPSLVRNNRDDEPERETESAQV